jgi:hypothetical protein
MRDGLCAELKTEYVAFTYVKKCKFRFLTPHVNKNSPEIRRTSYADAVFTVETGMY